jgi:hypothetical protein
VPGFALETAAAEDAETLADLRTAAAVAPTARYGSGPWSAAATPRGVLNDLRSSRVLIARLRGRILATLRLATRKPWAMDPSHFSPVRRPLYLTNLAVLSRAQRQGSDRQCLECLPGIVRDWPAEAIGLDGYDAPAGAGEFCRRCGLREVGGVGYRRTPLPYFERCFPG